MGSTYFVIDITESSEADEKSMLSFVLDGKYHSECAFKLMKRYQHEPSVIGVWHSHICGVDVFSKQDKVSNYQLSRLLNGALSMIVITDQNSKALSLTTYYIPIDGSEYKCETKVDIYKNIPSYLNNYKRGEER